MVRVLLLALLVGTALLADPASQVRASEEAALSPDQSAAVRRAVRYLNTITTLRARFVQVSSNGAYAEGEVTIARPGRLRFDYDPPHPVLLIANGLTLLFYDRELKQASFLPLWDTPLWFLIREEVKLTDNIRITGVVQDRGALRITFEDDDVPDAGSVTLVFSDRPLSLKKWQLVDLQGITTVVSLVNPRFGVEIDPELFAYDDLEIDTGRRQPDGH